MSYYVSTKTLFRALLNRRNLLLFLLLQGEYVPRKHLFIEGLDRLVSGVILFLKASLFLADRSRLICFTVFFFIFLIFFFFFFLILFFIICHGESLPKKSLFLAGLIRLVSSALLFLTASLFLAGRNLLCLTANLLLAGLNRLVSRLLLLLLLLLLRAFFCFAANLLLGKISSSQVGIV